MNPLAVAARGKGTLNMLARAGVISRRYGLTTGKMDRVMEHFALVLGEFGCGATFPITSVALARSRGVVEKYQGRNIEFAVHGYYHVDHTRLSLEQQREHLCRARDLFGRRGVGCEGFRSPYLRWSDATIAALGQAGFAYDSSQGLAWDVVSEVETGAYRHVLGFYGAVSATDYPALPRWDGGLVRIPYCLPDDEALIDRFGLRTTEPMARLWLAILERTYHLGELFTLALHPERVYLCEAPLRAALRRARELSPSVWFARLDEIARWWKARAQAALTIDGGPGDELRLGVRGPAGTTILARGVELLSPAAPWDGVYRRALGESARWRGARRPFIAVSPGSAPYLGSFLRQQGYIVEPAADGRAHALFLDRPAFGYADERPLLAQIEQGDFPLVRLGRWPDGARGALCVTGDIDALTLWDYGLRFLGT